MRISSIIVIVAIVSSPAVARGDDCDAVAVWRDGRYEGSLCRDAAQARGLTILDLSDDWVPRVLAPDGDAGPSYRATYLALAQERFTDAGSVMRAGGRNNSRSMSENIAALAPIPSASVSVTPRVNVGLRRRSRSV